MMDKKEIGSDEGSLLKRQTKKLYIILFFPKTFRLTNKATTNPGYAQNLF